MQAKLHPTEANPHLTDVGNHLRNESAKKDSKGLALTQLPLKKGLKEWGKKGTKGMYSEMKQLHFIDTFRPRHMKDLTKKEWKEMLESHIFLKQKIYGNVKGLHVAGGNKQRDFISKEDASSPTFSTEAVMITCVVDAEEDRDAAIIEIPNAFIQTRVENEEDMVTIRVRGILVDVLLGLLLKYMDHMSSLARKEISH